MVTGQLPFEGRGQSDLLLKPLTSAPIPPSRRVTGLPADLELLLLRCLARDPAVRPHDAFAFHDALLDILRRFGTTSIAPGPEEKSSGSNAPAPLASHGREPLETVVDRTSSPPLASESATTDIEKLVTQEGPSRWLTALAELETHITRARRAGGESAVIAGRAAELAMVASEMVPRVERATKMVAELQAKVDRLEAVGREFRGNLGHAIDVLVHDRSRERAHLDALRARRDALQQSLEASPHVQDDAGPDPRPWEIDALASEERRADGVVEDLAFQIETLQKQLDERNEEHERSLVAATGALEGSLSALRRLTYEVARTIDDGIDMLQAV
jgi:serine/threonine-protein kinase